MEENRLKQIEIQDKLLHRIDSLQLINCQKEKH